MHVVATAGHVDHGKSTLVRHLTGTDPDRWAEEKARGLTIDLGFAHLTLPSGREVSFIDVPGHVRFLKNMIAGLGAVDAVLFVVASTEGWKPQSEEHLRILDLLGIGHGIVALTKTSVVDSDLVGLAEAEIAEATAGTFLDGAPVVEVDAPAQRGIDDLVTALDAMLAGTPLAADLARPRMWVDRSFAVQGAGAVVTGTLAGGTVAVDDTLTVLPGGQTVRVRGIQRHNEPVDRLAPGNRTALNLSGISHHDIARGDVLVRDGDWFQTATVDASLTTLATLDHDVTRRGAYRAYLGSGEHPTRLRVLGPESISPGTTGLVRLHLDLALPLLPGDRYVLREVGRQETVGGGEILDVDPILPASRARPDRSVERVVSERGWVDVGRLHLLTGQRVEPTIGSWAVDPGRLAQDLEALTTRIGQAGAAGVDLAVLDDHERALLTTLEDVVVDEVTVKAAGAVDPFEGHPWLTDLEAQPFDPPSPPDDLSRRDLRELARRGVVIELDGIAFSATAIDAAVHIVAGLLADKPEGVTVSEIRGALGTSRKYALPIVGHLDATGRTHRRGDLRVAGPRLDAPDR